MSLRLLAIVLVLATSVLLSSCGGSGGASTDPGAAPLNTGLAVAGNFPGGFAVAGDRLFFLVNEIEQNSTDLNGDGDAADDVVHMWDPATGITNLGISGTEGFASSDVLVAWGTMESDEGETDINGDGDAGDRYLVVYDTTLPPGPTNPFITSVTLDFASPIIIRGSQMALVTSELHDSTDLNGDTDFTDFVVRVFDFSTNTVANTGLPLDLNFAFEFENGILAFGVLEAAHSIDFTDPMNPAAVDLNLDGDTTDVVLFVADPSTGAATPVGPGAFFARAIVTGAFRIFGDTANPFVVYSVDEGADANSNLNAGGLANDDDTADAVCAVFDVNITTEAFPGGGVAVEPLRYGGSATRFTLSASEPDNGPLGTDFNADNDQDDFVPFWVDIANPTIVNNVGVAQDTSVATLPFVCDEHFVFLASESEQGPFGTNYNQARMDTDTSDLVAFFVDTSGVGTAPVNLEFAGDQLICAPDSGDFVAMIAGEDENGGMDLTNDNDTSDEALIYFRVMNNVVDPTPIMIRVGGGNISVQDCATTVRFISFTPEGSDQLYGDLNKDGDFDDFGVISTLVAKSNGSRLGSDVQGTVSPDTAMSEFPIVVGDRAVAFPTLESSIGFGRNFNAAVGDTDTLDSVLFLITLTCP